jgi:FixJ family two-component response regulator
MIIDKPTVFVVDNDYSVRNRLTRLIETKGYRVECFASAEEFLRERINAEAACLVLEVNLPKLSGMGLQNLLLRGGVSLPIIFMTDRADISTAVRALEAGAISFLLKPLDENELMAQIENAFAVWHDELRQRSEIASIQRHYSTLTLREREILLFAVSGKLDKQTAHELGIVEETVKVHRRRIMKKMRAQSVTELVLMARKVNVMSFHQRGEPERWADSTVRPALLHQGVMARYHLRC